MRKLVYVVLVLLASAARAAVDPGLLAGMKARSIGPSGMSGRVAAIAAVESNPNIVYAGAATGGVWKSVNGGLTWTPLFDDQPVASIGAVAVFQANPDVVWVGTGEGNPRNSASIGNGVYRSLDGGKTWTHLGLEKTERIYRVVLHPTDPDVAWVSALGQEWGENPERGVFKTEDGGKTWSKVLYVNERTGASDLVMDPRNPNKLFASMWQYRRWPWFFKSGGPGSGLYVTNDGGRTWKEITDQDGLPKDDLGRIGIAISQSNPDVVYATVEAAKSAVVRSDNGGKTWKTVNQRYDANPRPFYFADLRVDPQLPNRVYSLDYNIRVSEDGGQTFSNLPAGDQIHGDYHAMWIDPKNPDVFYLGNDGGVAVSRDRGRTAAFVATLPLAQFYHVAVDMEQPYNVYGGLQDNGSWRGPNTVWQGGGIRSYQWQMVGDGDGFETRPDPFDPNYVYSESQGGFLMRTDLRSQQVRLIRPSEPDGVRLRFNWNTGLATDPFDAGTIYYGSQFVHKSTDRGESWTAISPDLTSNNPEWQKQYESGGLTPDVSNAENFTTIIAIAPSPLQKGVLWVGTDDGRLHVTRDGGKTWTSLEKNVPGVPANTWIPHILPSKFDAASAFVVFDNHRREDFAPYVYRTDDWGKSWKSLATKDLRGYAYSIEQDPADKDLLFLGTEFGLWVSLDGGGRWMKWTHGVPTVSVMDLVIHPRDLDLVIGTHGRAIYVLDDITPLRTLSDKTMAEPLHFYGASNAVQYNRGPEPSGFGLGAGEFRGENEPYGAILTYSLNAPGLPLPDPEKERARKLEERQARRKETTKSEEKPKTPQERTAPEPAPAGQPPAEPEEKEKGEAKKPGEEKPPEVEIRIADASGKVIRTFTAPAQQGLNRAVWDLSRDGFKQFPRETPPDQHPRGPQVAPGSYQVTVKYGDHEAKGSVRVLQDPRFHNTEEDWRRREDAIARLAALNDVLAEAIDRIRKTRADADQVVAKVTSAKKDTTPSDAKPDPLVEAAGKLKGDLDKLERRLWAPYDAVGIQPPTDVLSKLFDAYAGVFSSWEPPSPTHLEFLHRAETETQAILADVNRFFATDVATFRKQVDEAKIRLLPEMAPLEVKKP
ncbi:MAG TPA: hypothetical protein VGX68_03050 [Thermoanaerobaculia bacterium]|jgi:hypothetical protein|nr:hypothetical protein [Thermoanaerobaculia bacterium]